MRIITDLTGLECSTYGRMIDSASLVQVLRQCETRLTARNRRQTIIRARLSQCLRRLARKTGRKATGNRSRERRN